MAVQQRRQIAYKVRVKDILHGQYVKREGWEPNSINVAGREVSRVNLIATVVTKPTIEFNHISTVVDDGTGKISVRSFEEPSPVQNIDIGDVVLVIGRPREYNNERYLIPEIVRKIENPKWIELRQLELQDIDTSIQPQASEIKAKPSELASQPSKTTSQIGQLPSLIKKFDKGDGADYQQIIEQLNSPDGESLIEQLLKEGEIFEIKPGRLKVLE